MGERKFQKVFRGRALSRNWNSIPIAGNFLLWLRLSERMIFCSDDERRMPFDRPRGVVLGRNKASF